MIKEILKIDCMGNFSLYIEAEGIDEATKEVDSILGSRSWHFDDGVMCGKIFKANVWADGGKNTDQARIASVLVNHGWKWKCQSNTPHNR